MTQVDDYKSPWKDKYATRVNDTVYIFLNSNDDEISDFSKQVETSKNPKGPSDELSGSDKMVKASKEPIKDTHIHNTSVGTNSVDSTVTGVVIIGRGGRGITQGMISGGTSIIISNVITDVLKDCSKMILKIHLFPLNPR